VAGDPRVDSGDLNHCNMGRQEESLVFLWNIMHPEGTTTSLSFLACILSDRKLAKRSIETCDLSKEMVSGMPNPW
jgi:hypothetical protein